MAKKPEERSLFARASGVLLHVSSLPSAFGVGDLGPAARAWVELLADAKQRWWQVLPLGPPAAGDSPYQCYSAFAGNEGFISPEDLLGDGLLHNHELPRRAAVGGRVNYARVNVEKARVVEAAAARFAGGGAKRLRGDFDEFAAREGHWLDDYALFMALKEAHEGRGWWEWPRDVMRREKTGLVRARAALGDRVDRFRFGQFLFYRQLGALRDYGRGRGVLMIGDMPIFVAWDSADAWAQRALFKLDARGRPTVVAGVPPDLFSKSGQRWGNPLYDWRAMARDKFAWWVGRMKGALQQADLVRVDHFRGFEACWEIPANAKTAVRGRWATTPGRALLEALRDGVLEQAERRGGELPVIAEDLGLITPEVVALRKNFALPGMRVLQFAFGGGPGNIYLPHNVESDNVAYTGTHDNDTTVGWFRAADRKTRRGFLDYCPDGAKDPAWTLIDATWATVARLAIVPLQDVLALGGEARMNLPGTAEGNWGWRAPAFSSRVRAAFGRLAELTKKYNRAAE